MFEKNKESVLAALSDDAIFDEAVLRLKDFYKRKTGRDALHVFFEFDVSYGSYYSINVYKRQDFYRSQPRLTAVTEID